MAISLGIYPISRQTQIHKWNESILDNNCQKGSSPSHRQPCAPWALHVPPVWRAHSHDYCTIGLVRVVPRLIMVSTTHKLCRTKKNLKLFHGIRYGEWSKISTLKIEQLVIIYLLPIASVDHKMTNFVVPFRIPFCEHHPHHYNGPEWSEPRHLESSASRPALASLPHMRLGPAKTGFHYHFCGSFNGWCRPSFASSKLVNSCKIYCFYNF